ncbi:hypothetical protein PLICRDRAFT_107687 [Plicaturopsis crispa FD-325 SS-3]|nr:hypothetical protein PLICRDRAFT_107687 [Plicaturopsis crispa FD-325 SS-3]
MGNITASQMLNLPNDQILSDCSSTCSPATSAIQACSDSNDACLCANETVNALLACEQCMFARTIELNVPMSNMLAGSQPALTAYATACGASNITVPPTQVALTLPATWAGPHDVILSLPLTVIVVILGGVLGTGSLYMLSSL